MKKIIFIEELQLGNFLFQGYIVQHDNDCLAYSIFVNDFELPLIQMIADENKNVTIKFGSETCDHIIKNRTQDKNLRKEIFKDFMNFMINSEKKAAYMVFKNEKLKYIKSSKEIIEIKRRYIFG